MQDSIYHMTLKSHFITRWVIYINGATLKYQRLPVAIFSYLLFTSYNFGAARDTEVPHKNLSAKPAAPFM